MRVSNSRLATSNMSSVADVYIFRLKLKSSTPRYEQRNQRRQSGTDVARRRGYDAHRAQGFCDGLKEDFGRCGQEKAYIVNPNH